MDDGVELAIPTVSNLMGSEVLVGARVCVADGDSDTVSAFPNPKNDDCTALGSHRDSRSALESSSWIKKADTDICKSNGLLSRLTTEDVSQGLDRGTTSSFVGLLSGSDGKQMQRKVGKVPRNGSGPFKKLRMLQVDNSLTQGEDDDTKMELDKLGPNLIKCSNADKTAAVKQKSNINGRRADRRNYKVHMKAKYDQFSLKAGWSSFSPASGGSNVFGMYGLKPDVHVVTNLIDDISLDELLDGSYKRPSQDKEKGKKAPNVNENILDSVSKACSILRPRGLQQGKQTEEVDVHANKKLPLSSSPSNTSAINGSDGDESSLSAGLSKCSKDQESCIKVEASAEMSDSPCTYQPKDILERLALPPPKDLDSLLQDAVKPAASGKLTDSRSGKPLSHRFSLPPFPWSNNFNGHYKSNNDTMRISNRSTCQGRWVRIRSSASFTGGGGNKGFVDLDLLTYDDSLVPAGQVRYRLPEIEKTSSTSVSQHCFHQDSSSPLCSTVRPRESGGTSDSKMNALHSPKILAAAQTLCDIASHSMKHNSNGILKWPKQPSQKSMKARKSRSSEKTDEDFLTPKSEMLLDHVVRGVEYGSSSKKPKLSVVERREEYSHVQAVIGLSSVSAPRSSRSSPNRLPKDAVAEARQYSGSFTKPPFMVPPPPRVLDRSSHHQQKPRKIAPMDWNRTRS